MLLRYQLFQHISAYKEIDKSPSIGSSKKGDFPHRPVYHSIKLNKENTSSGFRNFFSLVIVLSDNPKTWKLAINLESEWFTQFS